jgi:hypothetical protein
MSFAPKPGCPMCGIVSQAQRQRQALSPPPSASTSQQDVLWRDENFTVYREKTNPVSSKGHIIVAFKCVNFPLHVLSRLLTTKFTSLHVPSIYMLVSALAPIDLFFLMPVPVFQRPSSPHFHPRHGYPAAFLSPPCGLASLFADICRATEPHHAPAPCPPIQFSHRLHYPSFPRLADPRYGPPARTCVHCSRRPVRLVPRRCV